MSIDIRVRAFAICVFLVAALSGCGGAKSKSEGADVTILPPKPIVITAPIKVDGEDITPPWFSFQVSMANNTGDKFVIVAIELEISGVGASGQMQKGKTAFAPGSFNYSLNIGNDETIECEFTNFGSWDTTETTPKEFQLLGANSRCHDPDQDGDVDPIYPMFYVADNPSGPSGRSFNYRVRMKPLGYFGTRALPTDRFEKTVTFSTR